MNRKQNNTLSSMIYCFSFGKVRGIKFVVEILIYDVFKNSQIEDNILKKMEKNSM